MNIEKISTQKKLSFFKPGIYSDNISNKCFSDNESLSWTCIAEKFNTAACCDCIHSYFYIIPIPKMIIKLKNVVRIDIVMEVDPFWSFSQSQASSSNLSSFKSSSSWSSMTSQAAQTSSPDSKMNSSGKTKP